MNCKKNNLIWLIRILKKLTDLIWFYKPEIEKIKPNPNKKKLKKKPSYTKTKPIRNYKNNPKNNIVFGFYIK
jgi:hypothetical protein